MEAIITNKIKIEISKIIPNDNSGIILREIIFNTNSIDWYFVAELIKKHLPEKANEIQTILDFKINS